MLRSGSIGDDALQNHHTGIFSVIFVFLQPLASFEARPVRSEALPANFKVLLADKEALPADSKTLSGVSEALTADSEALTAQSEGLPNFFYTNALPALSKAISAAFERALRSEAPHETPLPHCSHPLQDRFPVDTIWGCE